MQKSKGGQRGSWRRWKEGIDSPDLLKNSLVKQQEFRKRRPEALRVFTLGSCYY